MCADPNNLPHSNQRREGFENRIAEIVARELGSTLRYYWQPQRRGFVRLTLGTDSCDVIIGVPAAYDRVLTTRPYYRSSYVFVQRASSDAPVVSFDDPRLAQKRIGIQITGEDYENPPPAQALAVRHLADRVRGFTVYGDYSKPDPQRDIVDAVADGRIDIAAVWGPFAGFFAGRPKGRLTVTSIVPQTDRTGAPFTFAIAMGVRRGNEALRKRLDAAIARRRSDIVAVLHAYNVPLLPLEPQATRTPASYGGAR